MVFFCFLIVFFLDIEKGLSWIEFCFLILWWLSLFIFFLLGVISLLFDVLCFGMDIRWDCILIIFFGDCFGGGDGNVLLFFVDFFWEVMLFFGMLLRFGLLICICLVWFGFFLKVFIFVLFKFRLLLLVFELLVLLLLFFLVFLIGGRVGRVLNFLLFWGVGDKLVSLFLFFDVFWFFLFVVGWLVGDGEDWLLEFFIFKYFRVFFLFFLFCILKFIILYKLEVLMKFIFMLWEFFL